MIEKQEFITVQAYRRGNRTRLGIHAQLKSPSIGHFRQGKDGDGRVCRMRIGILISRGLISPVV